MLLCVWLPDWCPSLTQHHCWLPFTSRQAHWARLRVGEMLYINLLPFFLYLFFLSLFLECVCHNLFVQHYLEPAVASLNRENRHKNKQARAKDCRWHFYRDSYPSLDTRAVPRDWFLGQRSLTSWWLLPSRGFDHMTGNITWPKLTPAIPDRPRQTAWGQVAGRCATPCHPREQTFREVITLMEFLTWVNTYT